MMSSISHTLRILLGVGLCYGSVTGLLHAQGTRPKPGPVIPGGRRLPEAGTSNNGRSRRA